MIYLLRSWPDIPGMSLYSLNNQALIFSFDTDCASATVVHANTQSGFTTGQRLTYSELLTVLVQTPHIVTL